LRSTRIGRNESFMTENWKDLSGLLKEWTVHSSAPTRLPCGGSTDHRLAGLVCRSWRPATVNIAIDLRACVTLKPYEPGRIFVDIEEVGERELTVPNLPLKGPFALVSALVAFFGIHGFRVEIGTDFPFQSGLGGSGAVSIALIGAIHTALDGKLPDANDYHSIVQLAHNIEDSLFGNTGMQDQAAALYGGVNLWEWEYSNVLDFSRRPVLSDPSLLDEHILLAYPGRPHPKSRKGSKILDSFKENGALDTFASISDLARRFADHLAAADYRSAGEMIYSEYQLRSTLIRVVRPEDIDLIEMARDANCGVGVTGHGGGGCMWAIGEKDDLDVLRARWTDAFRRRGAGLLLPFRVSSEGLRIEQRSSDSTEAAK